MNKCIDTIEAAFRGVQLEDGISLREAIVLDNYGTDEERQRTRLQDELEDWRKIPDITPKEIFAQALDITDPADRHAFVDRACAKQAALRLEVESLLASHAAAGVFLQYPVPFGAGPKQQTTLIPSLSQTASTRVGHYKLL